MINSILFLPLLLSFFIVLISIPFWIRKTKSIGLVWRDMNKEGSPLVSGSGGLIVVFGFILGVLSYVALKVFYLGNSFSEIDLFAICLTVLISGFVGFVDDIFGWVKGGLSIKARLGLTFLAAVPLMVLNSGESVMMGFEFGLFYPLFLIPLGIIATTTTFNFLAGYNGLEASQGIIFLSGLGTFLYLNGHSSLSLICFIMVFSLVGFYLFNRCPARVFPGDILTYSVGALVGAITIMGNIEKFAVFIFIPYILETILKVRGGLKKYSFGKLNSRGSLDIPYEKFYGLEHIAIYLLKKIKGEAYERDVVKLINLFQLIIIVLGFFIFGKSLIF